MPRPPISLKARALKYLSSREHSRRELARKLAAYAQDGDDLDSLLNWLEQSRFLSEERFSQSLVNRRGARYGNNRILSELHGHGIEGEALADVKADLAQGEGARAAQVLRRKFDTPPADIETRARQMRFLQQRGFSHRSIREAFDTAWAVDEGDEA